MPAGDGDAVSGLDLRIALADDQALIRNALAALLTELGVSVAVQASDGQALIDALATARVDVIVSDIRMPRLSGLDALRALRAGGDVTPVLLLTTFDEPRLLAEARAAGAQGFLLKASAPEELVAAITRLAGGGLSFAPLPALPASEGLVQATDAPRLTPREQEILRLVAGGYSNKEVARALAISDGTVRNHLSDILARLDARDRTHAVVKAISARLL